MASARYQEVLTTYRNMKRVSLETEDERRLEPRLVMGHPPFQAKQGYVQVRHRHSYQIVDVSLGGVSFNTSLVFRPGTRLELVLVGALEARVEVVAWRVVHQTTDPDGMNFQVHCRFCADADSDAFITTLADSEDLELELRI